MNSRKLEEQFHEEMLGIYDRAKRECQYNATRFLQMVSQEGGLQAAHTLLATSDVSDGFTTLWRKDRLDLSVEALILRSQWRSLFSEAELERARKRLAAVNYDFTLASS